MANFEEQHAARERQAVELFEDNRIIIADSHFVYAAGEHGDAYVSKDRTIKNPVLLRKVSEWMTQDVVELGVAEEIDYMIGIAPCSSTIASRMAEHMHDLGLETGVAFLEKFPHIIWDDSGVPPFSNDPGEPKIAESLQFKRGFSEELTGKKLWLVEDVVNTGKSLVEARVKIEEIEGAVLLGASAEYSRTPEQVNAETLGLAEWVPLVEKTLSKHPADGCPMCADIQNNPIRTDLGHGAKFLAEHPELAV